MRIKVDKDARRMGTKWTAPPAATLARELGIGDERASLIRSFWRVGYAASKAPLSDIGRQYAAAALAAKGPRPDGRTLAERRLAAIDTILETHGVELLGRRGQDGAAIYYCNAGDTYAATLIATGRTLRIGCWADFLDPRPRRGVSFFNAHTGEFGRISA